MDSGAGDIAVHEDTALTPDSDASDGAGVAPADLLDGGTDSGGGTVDASTSDVGDTALPDALVAAGEAPATSALRLRPVATRRDGSSGAAGSARDRPGRASRSAPG